MDEKKLYLLFLWGRFPRSYCTQEEALQMIADDPRGVVWLDTGNGLKEIRDNEKINKIA